MTSMSFSQPVCLDLFAGGGGAALGYARTGFRVIGVDIADHSKSFSGIGEFFQGDWSEGLAKYADQADFIHASPPCQDHSRLTRWGRQENLERHPDLFGDQGRESRHPRLIGPVRDALLATGSPFVIENVEGAPLANPMLLCGWTFGAETYRHRLFERHGIAVTEPEHRPHLVRTSSPGHFVKGTFISVGGHCAPQALAREVMDSPLRGDELSESIPPYFAEWIGWQVLLHLGRTDAAARYLLSRMQRGHGPEAERLIWPYVTCREEEQREQLTWE